MPAVTFNYGQWALLYPSLARCVQPSLADAYFAQACLYLDNGECSIVSDVTQRAALFNLLVAHIAQLNHQAAGGNNLVGPIQTAQEGSVSVTVKLRDMSAMEAWFNQTPYGAQYWAATAQFRTMQYVPGQQPAFDPLGYVGY